MEIRLLTPHEYTLYDDLSRKIVPNLFIRSRVYGEFYVSMGETFCIVGGFEQGELVVGALCVTVHAKRGNYWYCPYGPIVLPNHGGLLERFVTALPLSVEKKGFDFFKCSPLLDDVMENKNIFVKNGFRPSPLHVLPETIWYLDLTPTEEELLMNMRKTTRNLVRRAERDGIVVSCYQDQSALSHFFPLFQETSKRHKFVGFSEEYIRKEFQSLEREGAARLYVARHEDEVIAASVIYFYGDTAVYRHGASTSGAKANMPGSYAIQWQAIQDAKKLGCTYYNFWGIAPENAPKSHPFSGITLFKTGFGGQKQDVLHCMDYPYTSKYWINWFLEKVRKWKRGF